MLTYTPLLLPFSYFYATRLRTGSIGFHVLFEWLAALVVVVVLAEAEVSVGLRIAFVSYIAFISLYEIGYIANDLYAAPGESTGRLRGPQGAPPGWVLAWVLVRLGVFAWATYAVSMGASIQWWAFFAGLTFIFATHNFVKDNELKAGTFLWLSWFRFMAPVLFSIPTSDVLGVALACAMSYSAFRQFGYLDSKGLLRMPGRRRPLFQWSIFVWPLLAATVLAPFESGKGYIVLSVYYACVASAGVAMLWLKRKITSE